MMIVVIVMDNSGGVCSDVDCGDGSGFGCGSNGDDISSDGFG